MRRSLSILFSVGLLASFCNAEPRWCIILDKEPRGAPSYPEFARLARVRGEISIRIVYLPSGAVIGAEPVSGPEILSRSLIEESKRWTIHTDATGEAPCQTLVIAKYILANDGVEYYNKPIQQVAPSVFEVSPEANIEPISVEIEIVDPVMRPGPAQRIVFFLKYCFEKMFRHNSP